MGLVGRAEVRFGDDLHQRCAGTIEVHQADGQAAFHFVHQLGHVLLHVYVVDAGPLLLTALVRDVDAAAARERQVGLGQLEALWQIGIVVDLLVEGAPGLKLSPQPQTQKRCLLQDLPAEPGHGARKPQAGRAGVDVGFVAVAVGAVAEHLGGAVELNVDLQADDSFEVHG